MLTTMMSSRQMLVAFALYLSGCCVFLIRSAGARAVVPESAGSDGSEARCDNYQYYYDDGTEMCEQCSEICQLAHLQGTEQQCQNNCPQYLQAMACKQSAGLYYDEVYGSCESCCDLCNKLPFPNLRCQQKCPDFLASQSAPASKTSPPLLHNQPALPVLPCGRNKTSAIWGAHPDGDWPVWLTVGLLVVALVIFLGVFISVYIIFTRHRGKTYTTVVQTGCEPDAGCGERTHRAAAWPTEDGAVTDAGRVTLVTAQGRTELTISPKVAFADLSFGHDVSTRCARV